MSTIYLQTDKDKTKDCPCTVPGCDNFVRVNTFYAPAKAKCGIHGGKNMGTVDGDVPIIASKTGVSEREVMESVLKTMNEDESVERNNNLHNMACPLCETRMRVLAVSEKGHMCFGCPTCRATVELNIDFSGLQVRHVPEPLLPAIAQYHKMLGIKMDPYLKSKYKEYRMEPDV